MTEHLCVCCPQLRQGDPRVYERANVCEGCRLRLAALLAEIAGNYLCLAADSEPLNAGRWKDEAGVEHVEPIADALPVGPLPNTSNGQRVSGSKDAPLPLSVDPLDLSLPARQFQPTPAARLHPEDQIGLIPVATTLDSWVRDWRDVLSLRESMPEPRVVVMTVWLSNRADKACDTHPSIDDFAHEIRDLARTLRRAVGVTEVRPEHLDVPCRRCDLLDLHRLPGQDRVECGSCGDLLTEDEYRRWVGLLASTMGQSA